MRLVEVVVLMGAHCVSPVEHTQMMTDAAKVQCAVVVEKDTDSGVIKVTPDAAKSDPRVTAAIAHLDSQQNAGGTRIVPAFAPAGQPSVETKPAAVPPPPVAPAATTATAAATEIPPPDAPPPADAPAADPAPAPDAATADTPAPGDTAAKVADAAPAAPTPPKRVAAAATPKKPDVQADASADPSKPAGSQCKGSAVPKWYKAADGHRKYRCVRPEPAGDSAPNQLY